MKPGHDPLLTELIVSATESARLRGVEVVWSTGPRWFADARLPEDRKRLTRDLMALAEQARVPHVVMTVENTPEFRDASLYADPSHLNRRGAELYSKMLADRLIELGRSGQLQVVRGGSDVRSAR